MKMTLNRLAAGFVGAGMLTMYGCGGGSDAPPPSPTVNVPVTVIDGPIQNAMVCLDKNSNRLCDTGEPFDKTDASGNASLTVDEADAGKYPVIAIVGTDATDTDRPGTPITVPFTLSAPADRTSVVSPLTTLVQQTVASTGASTADAAAAVQAATGITVSLFQDFTQVTAPTDGSVDPATVARMLVVTTQQQSASVADSLNTTAIDDRTITQADIDQAVQKKILELLPSLVAALADPVVLAANTPAAMEVALLAAATTLVADEGLTTSSMATVVAINTQASSTTPVATVVPAAGFNLTNLSYTNASNFFARLRTASMAQNTPESGTTRNVERRLSSNTGNMAKWGPGSDPWRGADLHWNGSAWVNCPVNSENTASVRDAQGNSAYNYCGNRETGNSNRAIFDVAGKSMSEVYAQIRDSRFDNLTIAETSALGDVKFPAESKLYYFTNTALTNAISYYPGSSDAPGLSTVVSQYSAAVSAGGVASEQPAGERCNSSEFQTNGQNSTTLEGMIAAMTGTPCIFTGGSFLYGGVTYTNPDSKNEAWGNSTVSIGTIGSALVGSGPAPGYYTSNTRLRAAFKGTGANAVTYYACKERFNTGSSRNCEPIGTGTYAIATLGDARVMTFNNLPSQLAPLTFTRVFVERGGLLYFGFQVKPTISNNAGLNTEASAALMTQLGITPEDPSQPLALTAGSYQGTWDLRDPANTADKGITVFIRSNGTVACQDRNDLLSFPPCSLSITSPSTGAFTLSDSVSTASGTLNFLTGRASGTFNDPTSTPATGNFVGQRR